MTKPSIRYDLRDEFELAKRRQLKNRQQALINLQDKLAALKFLDLLTESYLSLRRPEMSIEIDTFAAAVAQTQPNICDNALRVDGKEFAPNVDNINAYLVDGEDIFVKSRNEPIQADVPKVWRRGITRYDKSAINPRRTKSR